MSARYSSENLSSTIRLWGKLRKASRDGRLEDWLPLVDHCTDVASVFDELCRQPAIARSLALAAGRQLTEADQQRLTVLAFLHDIGKCNHGFQAKAQIKPRQTAGHVRELSALICDDVLQSRFLEAIDYPKLQYWFDEPEGALRTLLASVSHHGKPIELATTEVHLQRKLWLPKDDVDPIADISLLFNTAKELFPLAFSPNVAPLPVNSALQHRFAGLVMLADWLGSHAEAFFPYHHNCSSRKEFSEVAAKRAVAAVGLNVAATRLQVRANESFVRLFPPEAAIAEPTPLQETLYQMAKSPSPLLIAESDTGSGKTEAALGYFFRLFATGRVDSLYFALPTRVAARELYERILGFAKVAFGDDHPPVVLAVPGYACVDGDQATTTLPEADHLWHDETAVKRMERAWSAERPKRFLAAPIAVGTIDQALLSVMQVNHAHLRAVCLERALLVVDEVHASDTYMRGILRALLGHHDRAGGYALLLSATLGSDARSEFLGSTPVTRAVPTFSEAARAPYPSITDNTGFTQAVAVKKSRTKSIRLDPAPHLSDPQRMISHLADGIERGARILVVLNTVARVISLLRAAETHPYLREALFRVDGQPCPHHGRFARADRLLLDRSVSHQLGKSSGTGPLLLIGSQTLEQSLDIDADWLVTDLCPMDVLLQRIGRLHRHKRIRPRGFESPLCTVLVPDDPTLESFFDARGTVRGEAGLGKVYPDLRIARLTRERIGEGCEINIPADNRALVEWATHPHNLARFDGEPWVRHRDELLAVSVAHGQTACSALIPEDKFFGDPELCFRAMDEKLATRLGLDNRRLTLTETVISPFGQTLDELSIPGWMAKGIVATELDEPPQSDGSTLRFRYGGKTFRYTRFGLEFDDEREFFA